MKAIISLIIFLTLTIQLFAQWNQEHFTSNNDYLWCVYFVDDNNGWISGGSNSEGYLYKTTDGGNNWTKTIFPDTYELESIFFVNESKGWAVGDSGIVITTTDGGDSWYFQNSGTEGYLYSVFFIDENNGWICYGYSVGPPTEYFGVILYTTDGGQNWVIQKEVENYQFKSIFFIDNNNGWAAGGNHQNKTEIYVTNDGGSSWSPRTISTIWRHFYSIHFIDQSTGWLVGESGIIFKTTDEGNTWFPQTDGYEGYNLYSCYAVDQNKVYSAGKDGTILFTSNGGENWSEQESGTNKTLNSVFFIDNNTGWIAGYDGTILKTTNGGVTFIEEEIDEIPTEFLLSQNWPNPFNPITKINYQIPELSFVSLKIYEVLGNEVATLVNDEKAVGTYEVEFSVGQNSILSLGSGIYFYRLQAGNYIETKKMILLK